MIFQETRNTGNFEDWIVYMLVGIEEMADEIGREEFIRMKCCLR